MVQVTIKLLGKFGVWRNQQPVDGLNARKVQELLSYVLVYHDRPHAREALAGLLWGDASATQSQRYLRQTLWQLQSALAGGRRDANQDLLVVQRDWVRFNPVGAVRLDVVELESALATVQDRRGQDLDAHAAARLRASADLYSGDLLEGCYQDWCVYERERLRTVYLTILHKLLGYCEAQGEYDLGLAYGQRVLRHDPAHEATHRGLMRLHVLAGDRIAAIRQYQRCVAALAQELGVAPTNVTQALYERIRSNQLEGPSAAMSWEYGQTQTFGFSPSDMLVRLRQFQMALSNMQQQLQHEIQLTEQALAGALTPPPAGANGHTRTRPAYTAATGGPSPNLDAQGFGPR